MKTSCKYPLSDFCWIYISQDLAGSTLHIGYAHDLVAMLEELGEKQLLFYRQFAHLTDGLGHKLLLEKLGEESLRHTIRRLNPEMRDLKEDFGLK